MCDNSEYTDALYGAAENRRIDAARAAAPPVEPFADARFREHDDDGNHIADHPVSPDSVAGLREALMALPIYPDLDGDRSPSVSLAAVLALLDSPKPDGRREPGTYRTAEGGIEVIVGIEESASFVEDQFPDEVEYIVAARLRERET